MKRFFLFALAFMVSLSGLSVLTITDAKAASIYDGDLRTTTSLRLGNTDGVDVDITYDYKQVISDVCGEYVLDALNFSELNGSVAVSQENYLTGSGSGGRKNNVDIYFTTTPSSLQWSFGYIEVSPAYRIQLSVPNSGSPVAPISCYYSGAENTGGPVSNNMSLGWSNDYLLFYSTFAPNYPTDYEGIPVPGEPPISIESDIPRIGYTLDSNKKLYALSVEQDITFPTRIGGQVSPYIQWTVYSEDGETVVETRDLNLTTPYQYQFQTIDTYFLKAQYIQPPPPYALLQEDVVLGSVTFELDVNGVFVRGGNVDPETNECTTSGGNQECGIADPLEDCSTYGLDLGGYFQCIITNFGIWLRTLLTDLFVPSTSKITSSLSDFLVSLESQLGFVFTAFNMILEWLNTLLDITPDCTIDFPGVYFFGAPVGYNFCSFEEAAPTIYNPLMVGVRLLIAAFFVFISYRRLLDILRGLGK